MTPKEKAKELVEKFDEYSFKPSAIFNSDFKEPYENAKKCALICVDEIISTNPIEEDYEDHGVHGRETWYNYMTEYWQEVKQEIEKL